MRESGRPAGLPQHSVLDLQVERTASHHRDCAVLIEWGYVAEKALAAIHLGCLDGGNAEEVHRPVVSGCLGAAMLRT